MDYWCTLIIVLNLNILKILLFFHLLEILIIGPLVSILIIKQIIIIGRNNVIIKVKQRIKSRSLFNLVSVKKKNN